MKSSLEQERDKNLEWYERAERNGRIAKMIGGALIAAFVLIIIITQTNNNAHYSEGWVILGGTACLIIGIFLCCLDFTLG